MKYKGIELEGLDKKVKLSHSRVMEADEGTDWIDKLLTCDKAALTPTQFHEVSALSSVINMDYQICNDGTGQYVCNGYHEYRAPYSDDDVAQLPKHEQCTMLCKLADLLACAFGEGGKAARIVDWARSLGEFDPDAEPDDLYDEDEEEYFIGRFEEERYAGMDDSYYDICKEVAFLCEAYAQYLCKSYGIA